MVAPGMLHGALRFSDHPRARILRIDTSKARGPSGRGRRRSPPPTCPGERTQGSLTQDWRQLVAEGETTAYVGDVLAAVAAETRHAAREAAALVEVEYEVLEPVTDPFEALADGAPQLHEGGNVLSVSRVQRGDVDAALAGAAHVVTETFRTQFIEHAFLEPESSLAVPDGRRRRSRSTPRARASGTTAARSPRSSASPRSACASRRSPTGGAFGAKEDLNVQCHAALLATRDGPARAPHADPQGEPALPLQAPPDVARLHRRLRRRGQLLAVRARIVGDTGAYASVGDKVLERAAGHACGAYEVPNVDVEATAVYTNNPPCGAMRGFGVNQSNFAIEGVLDMLAERVGIDGWEIRWRNALERRRPLRHRAEARPGRRPQEDAARGAATPTATRASPASPAASRTPASATACPSTAAPSCAPEPRRLGDALPLLDGDGPGRPHGPAADRVRGARPAARARPRRRRHRARPRDGPDDGVPLDRARRPRRDRRGRAS